MDAKPGPRSSCHPKLGIKSCPEQQHPAVLMEGPCLCSPYLGLPAWLPQSGFRAALAGEQKDTVIL